MFLKKDKRPNGRIYLSIVKGFRDPITKKNKQRAVKSIGFLDEFEDQYDDPIKHFKSLAKEMTEEERLNNAPLEFSFDRLDSVYENEVLRKNFGFVILSYIYHKLNIDYFLDNKQQSLNINFSLNKILQALSFLRITEPCSKKKSTELLDKYFMDSDFSIDDVYRSLDYFCKYKKDLILHIHESIRCKYGRSLDNVFYDVTNYYFESDEDDFRKKGVSKEHRPNPLVQMGLLMDNSGLPITYKLFEGNTNIWVTNSEGKRVQTEIDQKQVVFYSDKYARKARKDRHKVLDKAKKLITFKKGSLNKGAYKYIKDEYLDKETGEILKKGNYLYIDEGKVKEEEKYDGYYLIVSSELNMPDREIIERYKGLWKIEETFKITKSELETRPVHVSLREHIEGHFLTCFVSLLLLRLIENQVDLSYSTKKLIDTMKSISGTYVDRNYYMFDYYDEIVEHLEKVTNIDFSKRFMTLGEIKSIVSDVKK